MAVLHQGLLQDTTAAACSELLAHGACLGLLALLGWQQAVVDVGQDTTCRAAAGGSNACNDTS